MTKYFAIYESLVKDYVYNDDTAKVVIGTEEKYLMVLTRVYPCSDKQGTFIVYSLSVNDKELDMIKHYTLKGKIKHDNESDDTIILESLNGKKEMIVRLCDHEYTTQPEYRIYNKENKMNTETRNFENERKILDSGARREFATGAVRDIQEGKGRCDLLPLEEIGLYLVDRLPENNNMFLILSKIDRFIHCGDVRNIYSAISQFLEERNWKVITALLEVSKHYEEGAKKYEERNWEKGIPAHCYIDSAVRHLFKWYDKWDDEPHDRAFLWNMFCLLWTVGNKPELNDLPYAQKQDCVENPEGEDLTPEERISLLKTIRESCDEFKKVMKGDAKDGK